MKNLLLIIFVLLLSVRAFAQQTDRDAIKQTVNTMFDAMRKSDSAMPRSTFAKGIVFQTVANEKDGSVVLETDNPDEFIKAVGTPHNGVWDELISITDIKIDGELASVWAPYKFYLDDKFSHCGVDVFQLMKTGGGWKIIYVVDTRRKDNCPK
ncbi:nuclear transport factor 2 family protein [Mucilaginibacter sabulilitoris]|uniref:Nuclear transport factor 2 family protein n=1 Tax=Mucilaginibacter sabulilitoris TaxID=1173583 RepID=A0ABZ0TLB4_9SPHI|nr:nuclear transport factor 2 family protein [Mucilaginibacter sabulilitoris]WPU93853.1 nuclear transport factor 2 family protein [Mucilaginibacter sabulilitoris]